MKKYKSVFEENKLKPGDDVTTPDIENSLGHIINKKHKDKDIVFVKWSKGENLANKTIPFNINRLKKVKIDWKNK